MRGRRRPWRQSELRSFWESMFRTTTVDFMTPARSLARQTMENLLLGLPEGAKPTGEPFSFRAPSLKWFLLRETKRKKSSCLRIGVVLVTAPSQVPKQLNSNASHSELIRKSTSKSRRFQASSRLRACSSSLEDLILPSTKFPKSPHSKGSRLKRTFPLSQCSQSFTPISQKTESRCSRQSKLL
jgi:hypothetical protein